MIDLGPHDVFVHTLLFIALYFELFLLVTFFERLSSITTKTGEPSILPTATVIVPCFNEEKTVAATVRSLLALDYPKEKLSIFIVNDGSTDGTWKEIQQFKNNPQIKLFKKENEGSKYTALNLGLSHCTSEIVGCLDADSFVDPSALKKIVKRFERSEVMAVTPAIVVDSPKTLVQLIQKTEYNFSVLIRKVFALIGSVYITPGPFSFFRKRVFDELGPYKHAHNTEDLEIGLRMQTKNFVIDNAHDAYVYTVGPSTLRGLFKQRLRWVHGFLENAIDYRFLFFKKGYGNLSFFILPAAMFSIFSALYLSGYMLWSTGKLIFDKAAEVSAVGPGSLVPHLSFDWFYFHTETSTLLAILMLVITLTLILSGKYIAEKKLAFSPDILYFIFLYGFIAPWWLLKAVYNTAFSRKTSWR